MIIINLLKAHININNQLSRNYIAEYLEVLLHQKDALYAKM